MNATATSFGWRACALATLIASTFGAPPETPPAAGSSEPAAPQVRLAAIEGYDSETDYRHFVAERISGLAQRARQAEDPLSRADLLEAAGNLILAHELEPACTNALLGRRDGHDGVPGAAELEAELRTRLDRADELLADAVSALETARDQEGLLEERWRESKHRLDTLQAFARAFRVYLLPGDLPGDSTDAQRAARRAASRLSALLEERDPRVAAAAKLWHACLRARETDSTPAMSVLDLVLVDPSPKGLRYAFFARLLRCRLLARRGGFASALALLTQIEERCHEWFQSETDREDAFRATTFVEIGILADWREQLSPSTHAAERQWCAERIDALSKERFHDERRTVLRLTAATPIIAPPPEPDESSSAAARDDG